MAKVFEPIAVQVFLQFFPVILIVYNPTAGIFFVHTLVFIVTVEKGYVLKHGDYNQCAQGQHVLNHNAFRSFESRISFWRCNMASAPQSRQ